MIKQIGLTILVSIILLVVVGCSFNKGKNKASVKDNDKLSYKVAKSIKLKGTHDYEMRQIEEAELIDETVKFTVVDGKLTKLQEISLYDESMKSEAKKKEYLDTLQNMVASYQDSDEFSFELIEKGKDKYQGILTYKLENYEPEDLLDDVELVDGKVDIRQMVYSLSMEGFKMQ